MAYRRLGVVTIAGLLATNVVAGVQLQRVAYVGMPVPEMPGWVYRQELGGGYLTADGKVSYAGLATYPQTSPNPSRQVYVGVNGAGVTGLVLSAADQPPDFAGHYDYSRFSDRSNFHVVDETGAFTVAATVSNVNNASDFTSALFQYRPGAGTSAVVKQGTAAAGTGETFGALEGWGNETVLRQSGGYASFTALLSPSASVTSANDRAIWRQTSSGLELVAREGAAAPGTSSTLTFSSSSGLNWKMNASGQILLQAATLEGKTGNWFAKGDGSMIALAVVGATAPGSARTFSELQSTSINRAGDVAFTGRLSNPGGYGLWLKPVDGDVAQAVGISTAVPGSPGKTFAAIGNAMIDADGTVFFSATYDTSIVGIFRRDADGTLSKLFDQNHPLLDGTFDYRPSIVAVSPTSKDLLIQATRSGIPYSELSYWFYDGDTRELTPVLLPHTQIELAPGYFENLGAGVPIDLASGNGMDGAGMSLNDNNQFAFGLPSPSNSHDAIFLVTVPEPTAVAAGLFCLGGLLHRRRRST